MQAQTESRCISLKAEDNPEIKAQDQSFVINNKLDENPKPSVTNLTWFPTFATPSAPNGSSLERLLFLGYHRFANALDNKLVQENIILGKAKRAGVLGRMAIDRLWITAVLQMWVHKYGHVTDAEVKEVIAGINQVIYP